jgi:restriction system protein
LTKNKGTWSLTPEGEEAIKLGADGLLNAANTAYKKWKNNQSTDKS